MGASECLCEEYRLGGQGGVFAEECSKDTPSANSRAGECLVAAS